MTRYVKFLEENDWEGEEWTLWLQLDGNEAALYDLDLALRNPTPNDNVQDDESPSSYGLYLDVQLNEHEVDVLVEHGGSGYMALHTRVDGVLRVPTDLASDLDSYLYKGAVRRLFVPPQPTNEDEDVS